MGVEGNLSAGTTAAVELVWRQGTGAGGGTGGGGNDLLRHFSMKAWTFG